MYAMVLNIALFGLVWIVSNVFLAFGLSLVLLYGAMRFVDSKKKF